MSSTKIYPVALNNDIRTSTKWKYASFGCTVCAGFWFLFTLALAISFGVAYPLKETLCTQDDTMHRQQVQENSRLTSRITTLESAIARQRQELESKHERITNLQSKISSLEAAANSPNYYSAGYTAACDASDAPTFTIPNDLLICYCEDHHDDDICNYMQNMEEVEVNVVACLDLDYACNDDASCLGPFLQVAYFGDSYDDNLVRVPFHPPE